MNHSAIKVLGAKPTGWSLTPAWLRRTSLFFSTGSRNPPSLSGTNPRTGGSRSAERIPGSNRSQRRSASSLPRIGMRICDEPATSWACGAFGLAVTAIWLSLVIWVLFVEAHYPVFPNAVTCIWIAGYFYFTLSTCLSFCLNLWGAFLTRPRILPELDAAPRRRVALVCPIFKEDSARLLIRLAAILRGNLSPDVDLWLLSDSPEGYEEGERNLIEKLRGTFPDRQDAIRYRRRQCNIDKKPGNITDFLFYHGGFRYDYLLVIDNDSLLPAGVITHLLRKAEHPANRRVFLFQARISVYNARTRWARFCQVGMQLGNRLHFRSLFFSQAPSFGHNCLIRTDVLFRLYHYAEDGREGQKTRWISRPLPTRELSHDVFDFTYASMLGYSAQYVHDVETFEEAPETSHISFVRSQRWAHGSLSALKLVFEPKASWYARFLVWHGGMSFLNSLFLFWLLLSFWVAAHPQNLDIFFTNDVLIGPFEGNHALLSACAFMLLTYFVLPFCAVSRELPAMAIATHLLISNLVLMQELTNGVYIVVKTLIGVKQGWTPMGVGASSSAAIWPTGIPCVAISAVALWMVISGAGVQCWAVVAVPMLVGGMLSPLVSRYLNFKPGVSES